MTMNTATRDFEHELDAWTMQDTANMTTTMMPQNENSTDNIQLHYTPYFHPTYFVVLVTMFKVITFIVGVVGNIMVMVVVKKNLNMRNSTNMFLVNLSVADLAVMVFCVPSNIAEMFGREVWYLGEAMCKTLYFIQFTVVTASVLIIMAISFERYFAICCPLKAQYLCTINRSIKIVIGIWIASLVHNIPFLVITQLRVGKSDLNGECVDVCEMPIGETLWKQLFIIANVAFFFVFPFVILLYIYGRIMYSLLIKNEDILADGRPMTDQSKRLRKQVVIMLIAVVLLFFICLTPFRVILIWFVYIDPAHLESMGNEGVLNLLYFCRIMFLINSAGNPILYNIFSSKFRMAFSSLLCPRYRKRRAHSFMTTTNGSLSVRLVTNKPRHQESVSDTTTILNQRITP